MVRRIVSDLRKAVPVLMLWTITIAEQTSAKGARDPVGKSASLLKVPGIHHLTHRPPSTLHINNTVHLHMYFKGPLKYHIQI